MLFLALAFVLFDPLLFSGSFALSFSFLIISFYFKYSGHVGTPDRSVLYKTRTTYRIVSLVLVL